MKQERNTSDKCMPGNRKHFLSLQFKHPHTSFIFFLKKLLRDLKKRFRLNEHQNTIWKQITELVCGDHEILAGITERPQEGKEVNQGARHLLSDRNAPVMIPASRTPSFVFTQ